jgi:hypothetical protein
MPGTSPPSTSDPLTGSSGDLPTGSPAPHGWMHSGSRPGIPWTRMLFIGAVCFGVWLLLDAPSLQRSATVSPLGTRRTVSLDIVGPIAALSRTVGLSHIVGWTDGVLGRTPGGGPSLATAAPGHRSPKPLPVPGVTPPGATTTTSTLPVLSHHPTAADPLRVLVIGDSLGLDLGQPLVSDLAATGVVTTTLDGRVDTGLSRPDYFSWPAELSVDMSNVQPQLVVVMMGANDPQSLVSLGGSIPYGAAGWNAAYGQRVRALIDEANAAGAHVLWVGMPPMAAAPLNAQMQVLNGIVQAQVAAHRAGATYVASSAVLADGQGNFTAYLPNSSGAEVNIRTPDGIHLAPGGGERLSRAVIASLRSKLHIGLP